MFENVFNLTLSTSVTLTTLTHCHVSVLSFLINYLFILLFFEKTNV